MTERRARRSKQLLGELKEKRGYIKLKEIELRTSHYVEHLLWKWLCSRRKADYRIN